MLEDILYPCPTVKKSCHGFFDRLVAEASDISFFKPLAAERCVS